MGLWAKGTRDIPHLLQEKIACRCPLCFVVFCNVLDAVGCFEFPRTCTYIYIYILAIYACMYIYLTVLRLIVACGSWDSMIVYIVHTLLAMVLLVGVRCANPT